MPKGKTNDSKKLCRICPCGNCRHPNSDHRFGKECGRRTRDQHGQKFICNCTEFVTLWPCPHTHKKKV